MSFSHRRLLVSAVAIAVAVCMPGSPAQAATGVAPSGGQVLESVNTSATTRIVGAQSISVGTSAFRSCVRSVDRSGLGHWFWQDKGAYGATDISARIVYVAPRTPARVLCDVVRHEYVHILQGRAYRTYAATKARMNALLGYRSSSTLGLDYVADCGALIQGATWIDYGCPAAARPIAKALLQGRRP